MEGTFLKGLQVPIVVTCTLWVDPHFEIVLDHEVTQVDHQDHGSSGTMLAVDKVDTPVVLTD